MDPTNDRNEEILWDLSREQEEAKATPDLSDEILSAYRGARLPEDEAARVEAALEASPAARARLIELSGLEFSAPPAAVRARVLSRFPARPARPLRQWTRVWLPAAAAACLLAVIGYSLLAPSRLPPGLAYEVSASGIARERAVGSPVASSFEAFPETTVRISVEPAALAERDVEFGLYRFAGGRIERLSENGQLTLETRRGSAVFTGRAAALVGHQPGTYDLFAVVARPGDLPRRLNVESGADPQPVLAGDGRRLVYRARLTLLPSPPAEKGR